LKRSWLYGIIPLGILALAASVLVSTASSRPAAPSRALAGKTVWEVDVLNSNPTVNAWAQGLNKSLKKAGAQLVRSFAVNASGQVDLSLQAQAFDRAIAAKPAAIVWLVIDVKSMRPQVAKAKAAGIPVFALYGKPQGFSVNAYIEARNYDQGYLVGKTLASKLKRGDDVTMITSFPTPNTQQEQAGALKALKEKGLHLVGDPSKQRNPTDIAAGGQQIMQGLVQRFPNLKGVFVYNDDSALGAIAAIRAAGKKGQILVASRNGETTAIDAIKRGDLLATCDIDPITIGATLGDAIVKQLNGTKKYNNVALTGPPAAERTALWPKGCLVTKQNASKYIPWDKRIKYAKIPER
jgi:ribose transport system substrate-binding protein